MCSKPNGSDYFITHYKNAKGFVLYGEKITIFSNEKSISEEPL